MYAVLEFITGDLRQCAVIPLLWLVDSQKNCYWPRTRNEQSFEKLVKENTPYQSSWPKCSVHRVLQTAAEYDIAVDRMNHILENGTSEDGGMTTNAVTIKPVVPENENDISSTDTDHENTEVKIRTKRKHERRMHQELKKKKSKQKRIREPSLAESFDSSDTYHEDHAKHPVNSSAHMSFSNSTVSCQTLALVKGGQTEGSSSKFSPRSVHISSGSTYNRAAAVITPSCNDSTHDLDLVVPSSSPIPRTPGTNTSRMNNFNLGGSSSSLNMCPSIQNTPGTRKSFQPMATAVFQETVLSDPIRLKTQQEEGQLLLTQILTTLEASLDPTAKPDGLPDFPLKDIDSFNAFEELLQSEMHFKYLKNRLSSIGGSCQRASVMGMLRFLLTNDLAMKFNWAGHHGKISFKGVKLMAAIMDAAKVQFKGKHSSDKFIVDAVQGWLKLAKSRFQYEIAKNK